MLVSPSILACDFSKLRDEVREVEEAGADFLHLDVMDGVFVPNLTFGPVIVEAIRKMTSLPLEAHLMIVDPLKYVERFAEAGADYITIHLESRSSVTRTLKTIKRLGKKACISLNPGTTVYNAMAYADDVEWILLMGVSPGFYGQEFNPMVLRKIEQLRNFRESSGKRFQIAVDGGIDLETGRKAKEAGADILISGAYVFRSGDRRAAVRGLKSL